MQDRPIFVCLDCGRQFLARVTDTYRRCGGCGSTSVVKRVGIKAASLAIKPWASLYKGSLPLLPSPGDVSGFPSALSSFFAVMGRAKTGGARRRAARLMLEDAGFSSDEAEALAAKMYPP